MNSEYLNSFEQSHNQTLCEINGELMNDVNCTSQIVNNEVAVYPTVHVRPDSLLRSTILVNDSAQSAFIEHSETLLQKLSVAWYGHGLVGVLSELSESSSNEVSPRLKNFCRYLLISLRFLNGMQLSIFPHLKLGNDELINIFSENNNWSESPIRYLAWHSKANKFALALRDDTIRIYYSNNDLVPLLKHKLQRNISVMAWKPLSASILAVGTQSAILIWTVDPNSLSSRPSASAAQVWSVALKEYQIIQHMTTSGGICRLTFSPDGSKAIAATPGSSFRVFEVATWSNERWSKLAGRVQASCWVPDGTYMLFSLYGDPHIYSITFPDARANDAPVLDGSKHASVIIDLTPQTPSDESVESPSNYIHSMVLDETGERLAVMFSKEGPRHHLVALYTVSAKPTLNTSFCGYVNGAEGTFPTFLSFKPNYSKGALLTICYSDGNLRYVPLFFQPITRSHVNRNAITPIRNLIFDADQSVMSPTHRWTS